MEESKESFIIIPDAILRMKGLSDGAKILYGRLLSLTKSKGYCFASNQFLVDTLGSSLTGIHRRLIELEEFKLIRRDVSSKGGRGQRKIYVNEANANYPKVDTQLSGNGHLSIRNWNAKYPKSAPIIDNIIDKPIDNIINTSSPPYREVIHSDELLPDAIPLKDEKPLVTTMHDIEQADRDYLKKQQQIMASQLNLYREKGTAQ